MTAATDYARRRARLKAALLGELAVRAETAEEAEHMYAVADELGLPHSTIGSVGDEVADELLRRVDRLQR